MSFAATVNVQVDHEFQFFLWFLVLNIHFHVLRDIIKDSYNDISITFIFHNILIFHNISDLVERWSLPDDKFIFVNLLHLRLFICWEISRGYPRSVMAKAIYWGIVISEFVLKSCYYVHFLGKYSWENYEPPYPPSYWLNSTTTALLGEWLWH